MLAWIGAPSRRRWLYGAIGALALMLLIVALVWRPFRAEPRTHTVAPRPAPCC